MCFEASVMRSSAVSQPLFAPRLEVFSAGSCWCAAVWLRVNRNGDIGLVRLSALVDLSILCTAALERNRSSSLFWLTILESDKSAQTRWDGVLCGCLHMLNTLILFGGVVYYPTSWGVSPELTNSCSTAYSCLFILKRKCLQNLFGRLLSFNRPDVATNTQRFSLQAWRT